MPGITVTIEADSRQSVRWAWEGKTAGKAVHRSKHPADDGKTNEEQASPRSFHISSSVMTSQINDPILVRIGNVTGNGC
jgi:hypothetical protein